jgi:mannose-6-phosphate isomerase-like protein (cupin superfamily)
LLEQLTKRKFKKLEDTRKGKQMNAIVLQSGEGRTITLGPIRLTVLEDGTSTRGTMAVAEFMVPPHVPGPFPHMHRAHEEGFYVLEGELEFKVDGETIHAGAGSFVMVPIGVSHTFSNPGDTPARFLNTFTPPQYIHYFEEMSEVVSTSGPLTPEQARAIMARYDTDVLG